MSYEGLTEKETLVVNKFLDALCETADELGVEMTAKTSWEIVRRHDLDHIEGGLSVTIEMYIDQSGPIGKVKERWGLN